MQQNKSNTESELEEDIPEMKHLFTQHLHSEFGTDSAKGAQDHQIKKAEKNPKTESQEPPQSADDTQHEQNQIMHGVAATYSQ